MYRRTAVILLLFLAISGIICPPVDKDKEKEEEEDEDEVNLGLEYERYLKEVVNVLETDDQFKKKLEESNISEIKSGEIARHLEFVSHNVRTKLDELKRQEMERIITAQKLLRRRENEKRKDDEDDDDDDDENGVRSDPSDLLKHLNLKDPGRFDVDDLSKLIKKATEDLEDIDRKRKEQFKTYEMEKEHLRKEKLRQMDERAREKAQREYEEQQKRHKQHPKVNHPGSEDQLKEVWEDEGFDSEEFDPKTFFVMHDANSDWMLDEEEVEALFQKELDKVYDPDNPDDDIMERYEEMNRMREHVFTEVDTNKDKLISLAEFLKSTQGEEFKKDEDWKTLDEEEMFTDEELDEFERQYGGGYRDQLPPLDQAAFPADGLGRVDHMQQQGQRMPPPVPQPVDTDMRFNRDHPIPQHDDPRRAAPPQQQQQGMPQQQGIPQQQQQQFQQQQGIPQAQFQQQQVPQQQQQQVPQQQQQQVPQQQQQQGFNQQQAVPQQQQQVDPNQIPIGQDNVPKVQQAGQDENAPIDENESNSIEEDKQDTGDELPNDQQGDPQEVEQEEEKQNEEPQS